MTPCGRFFPAANRRLLLLLLVAFVCLPSAFSLSLPTTSTPPRKVLDSIRHLESLFEQAFAEQRAELASIRESLKALQQTNAKPTEELIEEPTEEEEEEEEEEEGVVKCDVCIVGGGPAGCTCALYTARADLHTVIVDKNPALGALAITSHIANYPGVLDPTLSGDTLLAQIRQQAVDYGAEYRRAQVFLIDTEGGEDVYNKVVYTPEATYKAKALVLASGAMGRVTPPFPGEDTFVGQGVSYCATCDGAFYRDAEVAVKGISLEAMEEAQFLTKFAKTVHWVTPSKPRPETNPQVQELLASGNVQKWPLTKLLSVEGSDMEGVTGIQVQQKHKDEPETIPVEGVFIYAKGAGCKPITDYVDMGQLGKTLEYKENGGVQTAESMETNVPGVFAIGDIRNTAYKQVVVAAADGCIAAMSIDQYLKGRKSVKVDWIHK